MTNEYKNFGLTAPEKLAEMTGLEMIEAMMKGDLPAPPMAQVMPLRPVSCSKGHVEYRATPDDKFCNPMGTVHGGWAMTMLDTAMAVAAHTTMRRGELSTSLDANVKFTRPILGRTGELRIIGEVITRGRTMVSAQGRIEDDRGRIFALGTSTCVVIPASGKSPTT